jgi:5-formyltetrahydrofolate cyclo-ligase
MNKPDLRAQLIRTRDALTERPARSAAICERLLALPAYQAASAIHCYLSMGSEVDTLPLIGAALATGRRVAVPIIGPKRSLRHCWISSLDPEEFVAGPMGTRRPRYDDPALVGDWSLIIVPLLGFNRQGQRIGYGGGYYDRHLPTDPALAVGVAFAAQALNLDFAEPHDHPLDLIVTDEAVVRP